MAWSIPSMPKAISTSLQPNANMIGQGTKFSVYTWFNNCDNSIDLKESNTKYIPTLFFDYNLEKDYFIIVQH